MNRRTPIDLVLFLTLVAACDKSTEPEKPATPFTAQGTVEIDGKADSVKSCDLEGQGIGRKVVLGFASGARFTLPLHEDGTKIQRSAQAEPTALECKLQRSTEASNVWLKSKIEGTCSGEEIELKLDLDLECGTEGPSNRDPSDRKEDA